MVLRSPEFLSETPVYFLHKTFGNWQLEVLKIWMSIKLSWLIAVKSLSRMCVSINLYHIWPLSIHRASTSTNTARGIYLHPRCGETAVSAGQLVHHFSPDWRSKSQFVTLAFLIQLALLSSRLTIETIVRWGNSRWADHIDVNILTVPWITHLLDQHDLQTSIMIQPVRKTCINWVKTASHFL